MKDCIKRKTQFGDDVHLLHKSHDMVPHSWIMKCLDLVGVADAVKSLLDESMRMQKTNLMANGKNIGRVNIRRGIFSG